VACSEGSAKVSEEIHGFKYSVSSFLQFHDKQHCLVSAIAIPLSSKAGKYYSENSQINKQK